MKAVAEVMIAVVCFVGGAMLAVVAIVGGALLAPILRLWLWLTGGRM